MAPVCIVDLFEDRRDLNGEHCAIELLEGDYLLFDGKGTPIASCRNPERLGNWAFSVGAFSVRHNYNGAASCAKTTPAPAAKYHAGGAKVGETTDRTGEKVEQWRCADCGAEWTA